MYATFGLWSLFDPAGMTQSLGVTVSGPNGTFEMRGVFGGISLGAALMCMAGVLKPSMVRPALYFILTYMGGYCLARFASVALGDLPTPGTWRFVAFEAAAFLIAAIAVYRYTSEADTA